MADVTTRHPDYDDILDDWILMRDAIAGETQVKSKSTDYLPKPSGFTAQTDGGAAMYEGYLLRAKFPEILAPTLRGMVGIIHRIAADIELPEALEPLREVATKDGTPLDALHERITYELLSTGRYGLLVDVPPEGNTELPYLAGYTAETIINWSQDNDFYVLDETHLVRTEYEWEEAPQFRVLELVRPMKADKNTGEEFEDKAAPGVYQQILHETGAGGSLNEGEPVEPQMKGGKKFDEIPFTIIGSTDVASDIDEVPLIGVARCAANMFRIDADYKWQLFMSGQETLFVIADSEKDVTTVGAGVVINLPAGSTAMYVGPSGRTIQAQKDAIADERLQATIAGARLFDTEKKAQESGEALKMRWAAQTASLTTIALNSSKGLERALKFAAMFVGANPDEVVVKPNLRFIDTSLTPDKAMYLVQIWQAGAISKRTLDEVLQRGDIRSYDRTFEEEQDLIEQEVPDLPPAPQAMPPTPEPTAPAATKGETPPSQPAKPKLRTV